MEEQKSFNKQLMSLAIPFALQGLLNALVGASDALMLGRLTQESISAVSLANEITFILSLFTGAVLGGVGTLMAQYYGKKDMETVKKLLSMGLRFVFYISIIFFIAAFFMPDKLMMIFTDQPELIRIGSEYLRIVSFSYLFMEFTQCYLVLMKMDGRVKMSVWISAMTVVVDMTVDFFLIYGFGKIPALGANGSAYSTIVVEVIAFTWVVIASYAKGRVHPDVKSLFSVSKVLDLDMIKIALPMLASSLLWGLSMSAHSAIMGRLGSDATAAYAVTNVALGLIQCLSHGFAQGSGIMIGGLLGANKIEEAKEYGKKFWNVSIWCGLANMALLAIVGPLVYIFYVLEPGAKQFLIYMILYNLLYMFAYSFNTIFTCGVLPSGGDARYDAISVFIATWCCALPLAFIGCFVFHWPVMVVYCVMLADEIVKFPFLYPRYKKYYWCNNLTRENV